MKVWKEQNTSASLEEKSDGADRHAVGSDDQKGGMASFT